MNLVSMRRIHQTCDSQYIMKKGDTIVISDHSGKIVCYGFRAYQIIILDHRIGSFFGIYDKKGLLPRVLATTLPLLDDAHIGYVATTRLVLTEKTLIWELPNIPRLRIGL